MAHINYPGGGSGGNVIEIQTATLTVNQTLADNAYGSVSGVTIGNTSNVVQVNPSTENFKLRGFIATGTGDGYFFLQVDGVTQFSGRTSIANKSINVVLPNAQLVNTGSDIILKVTNEAEETADYEATILGE